MVGATTSSAFSWNSSIVCAPTMLMQILRAPTRLWVPSVRRLGPKSTCSRLALRPTLMRVPRGSAGWGLAMPQLKPNPGASFVWAKGVPIMTASAPAAIALQKSPPVRMPPSVMTVT